MVRQYDDLGDHILAVAPSRGWDPYRQPFRPSDLGIVASDYGSFLDWCPDEQHGGSVSGRRDRRVCLRVKTRDGTGSPVTYLLLPKNQWLRP